VNGIQIDEYEERCKELAVKILVLSVESGVCYKGCLTTIGLKTEKRLNGVISEERNG
jgi:hypothetical protein